jgi:hypothetical protein
MKLSERDLEQMYRSMTSRHGRQLDDCLSEELLTLAASDDLDDARRVGVVAHLTACSDCARYYRIASSIYGICSASRKVAVPGNLWWSVAAAAAITLISAALIWTVVALRRSDRTIAQLAERIESQRAQIESARQRPAPPPSTDTRSVIAEVIRPQLGVPIVDLDADLSRGANAVPAIAVPSTSDVFTLILHLNEVRTAPLDLALADKRGTVLWRDRLAPDPESSEINLALNRRAVPPGIYSIDVRSATRKMTFRFRVEY